MKRKWIEKEGCFFYPGTEAKLESEIYPLDLLFEGHAGNGFFYGFYQIQGTPGDDYLLRNGKIVGELTMVEAMCDYDEFEIRYDES